MCREIPESPTAWTRAIRAVEGKEPGRYLRIAHIAFQAGEALAEDKLLSSINFNPHYSIAIAQGQLKGLGDPVLDTIAHQDPINHQIDVVPLVLVENDLFTKLCDLAVYPYAN